MGKTVRGSSKWNLDGNTYRIENVCSFIGNTGYFLSVHVDDL